MTTNENIPIEHLGQIAEILAAPRTPRAVFKIIFVNRSAGHIQPRLRAIAENFDFVDVRVVSYHQQIAGMRADLIIVEDPPHTMRDADWLEELERRLTPTGIMRGPRVP